MTEEFLRRQEQNLLNRMAAVERVIRSGRLDAGFKARSVFPSQQRALARLYTGNYGICVDCDRSIPRDRLERLPGAIRCIECQEIFERGAVAQ